MTQAERVLIDQQFAAFELRLTLMTQAITDLATTAQITAQDLAEVQADVAELNDAVFEDEA
jgi:hypothetical protein